MRVRFPPALPLTIGRNSLIVDAGAGAWDLGFSTLA